ncbi:hypothetical protein [Methylomonas rivi]|uniref:Uncharacterized protein n=1 Tax=Methylomonas rivi TaxID=2952226 RepID=A0ABT1U354_9GAMM|nr:hypothetical protein [Methylomonas sp. WSC-6]MBS4050415.1 hypothetical protein [Methylomonas sp.]MCQ8128230.1 hypothetical protein [Methylomonas sp. WSC-6]
MKEPLTSTPRELLEIEQLIDDLMGDFQHPIHNRRHPQHEDCAKALDNLIEHADKLRNRWLVD